MSRWHKLRRHPEQFFRDSRSPVVRTIGAGVARVVLGPGRVTGWLDEPREAALTAGIPVLSALAHAGLARESRRRRQLLTSHGQPTVSIIMAAFNAADTIAAAVASVQSQSYAGLELLVVNDASSDATVAIVDELARNDRRVHVIHSDGQAGAAGARNLGLAACTGEYITFHDADDVAHPERIERQLAALVRSPSASVSLCNGRRVTADGEPVLVNGRRDCKWVNSMMFPRRVFRQIGYLMRLRVSEDAEYYKRIKLVFGAQSERRLFKTLYFARFAPDSLLFSDGATTVDDTGHVSHRRSAQAEAMLVYVREVHARMRRHEQSCYVAFDSPINEG